jgi:hypothetical protein
MRRLSGEQSITLVALYVCVAELAAPELLLFGFGDVRHGFPSSPTVRFEFASGALA